MNNLQVRKFKKGAIKQHENNIENTCSRSHQPILPQRRFCRRPVEGLRPHEKWQDDDDDGRQGNGHGQRDDDERRQQSDDRWDSHHKRRHEDEVEGRRHGHDGRHDDGRRHEGQRKEITSPLPCDAASAPCANPAISSRHRKVPALWVYLAFTSSVSVAKSLSQSISGWLDLRMSVPRNSQRPSLVNRNETRPAASVFRVSPFLSSALTALSEKAANGWPSFKTRTASSSPTFKTVGSVSGTISRNIPTRSAQEVSALGSPTRANVFGCFV